jgi:hypothetical protein
LDSVSATGCPQAPVAQEAGMSNVTPLLAMMCFLTMAGAIIIRPLKLQIVALVLMVIQVGMTIFYVVSHLSHE